MRNNRTFFRRNPFVQNIGACFVIFFSLFTLKTFGQAYPPNNAPYTHMTIGPFAPNVDVSNSDGKARDEITISAGTTIKPDSRLYIDPSIQAPVSYTNTSLGQGFSDPLPDLDKTLDVGTLSGQESVNLGGGATYFMPFELAKSTGGVVPTGFGIEYSSGGNMGNAGLGWNITGLHSITRSGQNLADDESAATVNLTNSDWFVLNGQRLIPEGPNGHNGTVYHTQQENFSRIISYTTNNNLGPEYWEITTKEGTIIEIGKQSSKIVTETFLNVNAGIGVIWSVNKITDRNGNYILYEYDTKSNTELALSKIKYAGNDILGKSPNCEISLHYNLKTLVDAKYIGAKQLFSTVLLREIEVKMAGQLYLKYTFSYNKKHVWEYLTSVQNINKVGNKFNPTHFKYDSFGQETDVASLSFDGQLGSGITGEKIIPMDFNGDGYTDLVYVSDPIARQVSGWQGGYPVYTSGALTRVRVFQNNKNATNLSYTLVQDFTVPLPDNFPLTPLLSYWTINRMAQHCFQPFFSDFNGDGLEDMVIFVTYESLDSYTQSDYYYSVSMLVFEANSSGFNFVQQEQFNQIKYSKGERIIPLLMDIDSDKKTDIVILRTYLSADNSHIIALGFNLSNAANGYTQNAAGIYNSEYNITNACPIFDNVSGKYGINNVFSSSSNIRSIFYIDDDLNFVPTTVDALDKIQTEWANNAFSGSFGDFNGDGYQDNLIYNTVNHPPLGYGWTLRFGLGNGFNLASNSVTASLPVLSSSAKVYISDLNNDSKSDLVVINKSNDPITVDVYYSFGNGFLLDNSFTYSSSRVNDDISFADVDGNGILDILFAPNKDYTNTSEVLVHLFHKSKNESNLNTIRNGLGALTQFTYKPINWYENLNPNLESYPYNNLRGSLLVTSQMNITGGDFTRTVNYDYKNGVVDCLRKSFLGFKIKTQEDILSGKKTASYQNLNMSLRILLPDRDETSFLNPVSNQYELSSKDSYEFAQTTIYGSAYFNKKTKATHNNPIKNINVEEWFGYDSYGNITSKTTHVNSNLSVVEVTTVFDQNNKYTLPFLPLHYKIVETKDGNSVERRMDYIYDTDKRLQSEVSNQHISGKYITKDYTYYNTGAVKNVTVTGYGLQPRVTSFVYDDRFKNVLNETNLLGQTKVNTYNALGDQLITVKDFNGLSSNMEYDSWNRITMKTLSSGVISNYYLQWAAPNDINGSHPSDLSNNFQYVSYKKLEQTIGSPASVTYYDCINRPLFADAEGYAENSYSGIVYNNKGQIFRQYAPYTLSNVAFPIKYTEIEYDYLGRNTKTSVKGPSQTVFKQIAYSLSSGYATTTATGSDGSINIYKKDALNRPVAVIDNASGTISYLYFSDGLNITRTQTKIGSTVMNETTFDEVGNKTMSTDKQNGTSNYTYNALGELTKQVDANSNQYIINYKADGRLDNKVGSEGTYNYIYETALNRKHLIRQIAGPTGDLIEYGYNTLQRVASKKETYNSIAYQTGYEYDANGNETKYTFPSGYAINRQYSSKGFLEKISEDVTGVLIWKLDEINAIGKISKYTLGNNLSTIISYDEYGQLLNQSTDMLEDVGYSFNPHNGNLDSRSRAIFSNTDYFETFTYDALNRLKDFSCVENTGGIPTPSPLIEMDYDNMGKLQKKTDAGLSYKYNTKLKLNKIEDAEPAISQNVQEIQYTSFNKPSLVTENNNELSYTYNPLQERYQGTWKQTGNPQPFRKRIYLANYEINDEFVAGQHIIHQVNYINTPTGLGAMYVIDNATNQGTLNFTYTDHLGSITTVTGNNGDVIARQNFDPWGRRRNALNYTYLPQNSAAVNNGLATSGNLPYWLYRGFTGHEMLDEFVLINMNARLYDPVVGMMMSPDNVLQNPANSQNYHKYAYCFNNPLKYIDPTGNEGELPFETGGNTSVNWVWQFNNNYSTGSWSNGTGTNITWQSNSYNFSAYDGNGNSASSTSTNSQVNIETPQFITTINYSSSTFEFNGNKTSTETYNEITSPNFKSQIAEAIDGANRVVSALNNWNLELQNFGSGNEFSGTNTVNTVTNAGGLVAGVAENAAWQTGLSNLSKTTLNGATFVKYANTVGSVGIGFSIAGNALSMYNTAQTGIIKGSDILGYAATGIAIGGAVFLGIGGAPVLAIIGIGFGLTQMIGGDYFDANFSYQLFDPNKR